jgi:uncharacterized protein YndB with AHSA1/START domain
MNHNAPHVPLRLELSFELPGTPERVWNAIATADGISSWFIATELDERVGGVIRMIMGPEGESVGSVTGWEPPRRFAYVEPDWAAFSGHERAEVTPLATEFVVEAQSGGTCAVRVVSSAFGTGADWEREFFAEMERGWAPFFENLRLYLTHFPGQVATTMRVSADVPDAASAAMAALGDALGAGEIGRTVEVRGLHGTIEAVSEMAVVVHLAEPARGYLMFMAYDIGNGSSRVGLEGYLFSADAAAYVEREESSWREWLGALDGSGSAGEDGVGSLGDDRQHAAGRHEVVNR